jgi:hypothetical protein
VGSTGPLQFRTNSKASNNCGSFSQNSSHERNSRRELTKNEMQKRGKAKQGEKLI